MLKEGCPSAIKNCSGFFSKLIDPEVRNTLLSDIAKFLSLVEEEDEPSEMGGRITTIAEGPYKALQIYFHANRVPREARTLHCYTLNHLSFSTFTRHRGNSLVLVRRSSLPSIPAQIDSILQISTQETLFCRSLFSQNNVRWSIPTTPCPSDVPLVSKPWTTCNCKATWCGITLRISFLWMARCRMSGCDIFI